MPRRYPPFRSYRRLSGEDAWAMRCWNAPDFCEVQTTKRGCVPGNERQRWSGYSAGTARYEARLHLVDPTACPRCGAVTTWNGFAYYCDRCDPHTPIAPEEYWETVDVNGDQWGAVDRFSVASPDDFYADTTALYRVPAASNGYRARNDPHVRKTREGIPRPHANYRQRRSKY